MDYEPKRKRGRPTDGVPKNNGFYIRLSNSDVNLLNKLAEEKGISKAEVLRKGLMALFNQR